MNTDDILALYDQQMRIAPPAAGAEIIRQDGLTIARPSARSSFGGWIIYTRLAAANADEVIRDQVQAMRASGKDWEWKTFGHDTPPDLKGRLLAHGFEAEEPEALLALDLAQAPGRLWEPVKADLRRLTRPEEIDAVVQVHDAVWGETGDDLARELRRDLAETPLSLSVYAVYDQGQPVSAAWIRFHEGRDFADLWGGSTIAAYRGRGYYSDLVAVRAQEARARGFRFLTIDASDMSRPILEKIGFRFLTWTQPFVWHQAERSSISQA